MIGDDWSVPPLRRVKYVQRGSGDTGQRVKSPATMACRTGNGNGGGGGKRGVKHGAFPDGPLTASLVRQRQL